MAGPCRLENDPGDIEPFKPLMRARWPSGLFVMRKLSPPGWIATSRVSFEMSTPTLCATVDLIFSQSSSCLGGMTPGCPFCGHGKEEGWSNYSSVLSDWRAYDPSPPAAGLRRRHTGGRPDPAGSDGKTIRQGALSAEAV